MTARDELLDRCVGYLRQVGIGQRSLREIASGAGTSHRMLIYHFGGREGLLAEVVGRIEAEQREALAALAATEVDPGDLGALFWRRLADPELAPAERLFFEIYVHALHGPQWTESFRAAVIDSWLALVTELFERLGFDQHEARLRARVSLAASRGLLLDLLLTGDRAPDRVLVDEAAQLLGQLMTRR
jgi:AcrR family transcriptional regulator